MGQAGVFACPIIRGLGLVVELQRKLDVSRRLRRLNHSGCTGLDRRVGYCQVDAVKGIQEIRTELQSESFCQREVFLQAQIPVVVSGSAQSAEFLCTGAEAGSIGIFARVKPKAATTLGRCSVTPAKNVVLAVAVRAQAARRGTGLVLTVVVEGQWEPRVESYDRAYRPTANDGVHGLAHISAIFL